MFTCKKNLVKPKLCKSYNNFLYIIFFLDSFKSIILILKNLTLKLNSINNKFNYFYDRIKKN